MVIRIYSRLANETWEGDVPGNPTLDDLFHFFNRVDEEDCVRLEKIGYKLPSLSVGDRVEVDGFAFEVAPVGWEPVSSFVL